MRIITIQKISYDKFEVTIRCEKCKSSNKYILCNISTKFPYSIKQIIDRVALYGESCYKCQTVFKLRNLKYILIKDKDNVLNSISYNIQQKNLYFKNKIITCKIKINKNKYKTPIHINTIKNKKGNKVSNYCIDNDYVNFIFYGWIKTFLELQNYLIHISDFPFELTSKGELNTIKIKPPTTKQQDNTDIKFSTINKTDVLVISDLRRCTNQSHTVKDVVAILYTVINGYKQKQYISASFCFECCRYTISQNEFNNIKGKPICQIKWHNNNQTQNNIGTWDFNTQHSILYNLGYNVQRNNNLTPCTRRQILINAIQSHKLSKGQVCSYLETFINQKKNQPNMKEAVAKWQSDLQYIYNIKIDTKEQIYVKSITKK